MGFVKIRKKYRFVFCVLNIEEDISYTNIPQINTGFADFLIISKIFHGKKGEEIFKITHYAFVTPMEYIWRLDTLATAIPLLTSPENSSIGGTKCPPNVKSRKQHLLHFLEDFFVLTLKKKRRNCQFYVKFHSLPSCITNKM